MMEGFLPILIFIIFSLLFAGGAVLFSAVFGLKKSNPTKLSPYECGMPILGEAQLRFAIKFFIVAVLFLIFDVEGLTLFPWAVIYKQLGAFGLIEMGIFIAILFAGLVYIWRKGALIWE